MRDLRLLITQTLRAAKALIRDERIPRPLRWGGAFGVLPLPGPLDEAVLLLVGALLWVFYRDEFREAWSTARVAPVQPSGSGSSPRTRARGWLLAVAALIVFALMLVIGSKVIGRWYYDPALSALAGWSVPPDFSDFYLAADAVLAGNSPYQIDVPAGWLGYVYPPLLAWLMTPLTLFPVPVAVSVWAVVSVLFVVAALWILGVRDWRCYPVALLWPFHREVIEFGTIDSLLVFVVALCWRYRDAPVRASVATGFVVSLKLFLWPLALWLGLSGRLRTAALSVVTCALFVVVPWALIDFQDVTRYPGLVREVSQQQGGTYSLASFGETLGFAPNFATVLSALIGAGLLYLAYRAAREPLHDAAVRDQRSLTLTIAAALALTPVVWNHYFVLLLIPVAIARPRLSGLWLAPLALNVLYLVDDYGPSPDGRLVPLAAVTGVALGTILLALQPRRAGRAMAVPSRARGCVRRTAVPALAVCAVLAVLAVLFVLMPEKLNDRPYNPLGRDTSHTSQPTSSSG